MKSLARSLAALALCLAAAMPAMAALLPGPLVTPEWLDAHRDQVVVLDVREDPAGFTAEPEFAQDPATNGRSLVELGGHIPGALKIDFSDMRTEKTVEGRRIPWMLPDADQFQALMRAAGVPAGTPIVIVTQATTPEELDTAARAYWSIKYYGDDDLAILDGGMARWLEEGHAVESAVPSGRELPKGDWKAGTPRTAMMADSGQVASASKRGVQLIDARPAAFYYGLQKRPAVAAAGHIGNAFDFPAELHARPVGKSQRFLSVAEYRSIFATIGIQPNRPLIAYCNTGHMAAGAWFITSELLGNRHAALYDGSMLRWAAEGRPVVTAH